MHVNHSYISSDFADLMEKELTLREQFRNYELDYSKNLEVKYNLKAIVKKELSKSLV